MHNKVANPDKVSALMRQGMSAKQAVKAAYPSWSNDRINQFVSNMETKESTIEKESTVNKLELYLQKEAADKKDAKKYLGVGAATGAATGLAASGIAGKMGQKGVMAALEGKMGPEAAAMLRSTGLKAGDVSGKEGAKALAKHTLKGGAKAALLGTAIGGTALGIKHLRDKKKGKKKAASAGAVGGAVKEEAKATLKMKLMALLAKGGEGAKRYTKSATGGEVRAAKREGAIATKPLGEAMRDLTTARKQMWKDLGKGGVGAGVLGGGTALIATKGKKSGGKKKSAMVLSSSDNQMFISGMKQASVSIYTGFDKEAAPVPAGTVVAGAEKGVGWLAKLLGWGKAGTKKAGEQAGKLGETLKATGKEGTKLNQFGKHMADNKKLYGVAAGTGAVGAGTGYALG